MSTSSAIGDSGKAAGSKTTFSQTCNLLSQYLKEKRSVGTGDLSLGISDGGAESKGTISTESFRQTTMNLFPQQAGFGSYACVGRSEAPVSQMTIFYGGQVIVFNDFPAEKAKEIMEMAGWGSSAAVASNNSSKTMVDSANLTAPTTQIAPNFGSNVSQEPPQRPAAAFASDLPIARKASLHRFFEKRKDRITARAPYMTSKPHTGAALSGNENNAWLNLAAAQASLQSAGLQI